jgi:hypothetical protein
MCAGINHLKIVVKRGHEMAIYESSYWGESDAKKCAPNLQRQERSLIRKSGFDARRYMLGSIRAAKVGKLTPDGNIPDMPTEFNWAAVAEPIARRETMEMISEEFWERTRVHDFLAWMKTQSPVDLQSVKSRRIVAENWIKFWKKETGRM